MKAFVAAIFFSAILVAVVTGEQCSSITDCILTVCRNSTLLCSDRKICTCASKCTTTHERCLTRDHCVHDDPCKNQGGCGSDSSGKLDYHCIDNLCHCGFS